MSVALSQTGQVHTHSLNVTTGSLLATLHILNKSTVHMAQKSTAASTIQRYVITVFTPATGC